MHDSFPHALELSKLGYNAFALIYRPGAQAACEDLARAISFIFEHAEELAVSTGDYSLWGGSAGARMAAYLGSYGPAAYGGGNYPRPGAVIMQYTGHSDYTRSDPPTFVVTGENDGIANWRTMEQRVNNLKAAGIDAEFHVYPNIGHGFGLGIGTTAEGWFENAVACWERHINAMVTSDTHSNTLYLQVGETIFTATLVDNSSTEALKKLLAQGPITIDMRDYGGFEKVGSIGTNLPTNDERITSEPGDLILYQGNSLVIFYAANKWSYTRLGKINDITQDELKSILGDANVTVTLSLRG
jgi:hypothetical protein